MISTFATTGEALGSGTYYFIAEPKVAIGMHTWLPGYLAPVYEGILNQCEKLGYDVARFTKDMDAFMAWLTKLGDLA